MNRQTKRMLQRQKATPQDRAQAVQRQRAAALSERRKRVPAKQFLKEVSQELKKVNWPSRQEVFAYTVVVLVAVVVLTSLVFGMDLLFSKGLLRVFNQ